MNININLTEDTNSPLFNDIEKLLQQESNTTEQP